MYGIPDDFDPAVFNGLTFSMVCYATNLIALHFDEYPQPGSRTTPRSISVTVHGPVGYCLGPGVDAVVETPPVSRSDLMALVGQVVELGETTRRELALILDKGGRINVTDEFEEFESFVIRSTDLEIVV